jgi:tripartite-type tricarboxylate transporter receptor subunit TctC
MFSDVAAVLPHVKSGRLKALGIGSTRRFDGLPDVPTISEAGVPGFEGGGFLGLVAPAGTPAATVSALNSAAAKTLAVPDVRARLVALATVPIGGSPDQFGEFLKGEIDKWAKVIHKGNIKAD